jgi:hypothetical protein
MKRATLLILAGFSAATVLAACGKEGDLERPGPLWSPQTKADYAAQKRAQADAASNATAAGRPGQPPAQGPGSDAYANPSPPSQAPIPGEKTYPSGAPQTGAQPQPQ